MNANDNPGQQQGGGQPGQGGQGGGGQKPGQPGQQPGQGGQQGGGQQKPGQQGGKPGAGKEAGKPGDGKPGAGKEGKPGDGKPGAGKEGKPGDGKPGSKRMLIFEMRLWSTNYPHNTDSGAEFYGTKGQMYLSRRGKIEVRGDRNAPVEVSIEMKSQDDEAHVRNFCDAIRGGGKVNADALTGHLTSSLCHLGNIASRLGRSLTFNPL